MQEHVPSPGSGAPARGPVRQPGPVVPSTAHRAGPAPAIRLGAAALLSAQRQAGNAAVATVMVQREPPVPVADQLDELRRRQLVLERKQASTALDLEYRGKIGQRLSAYRQGIYRLTTGFQTATNNFQTTQRVQAELDAIKAQLLATLITTGAAGLYEPLLSSGLGVLGKRLGRTEKDLATWVTRGVEKIENPLNAATSGIASTAATGAGIGAAEKGQAAGATSATGGGLKGGDPITFLTQNLDAVEGHSQQFDAAFQARGAAQAASSPEDWSAFSPDAQRASYEQMLASIDASTPPTADRLRSGDELARVIEQHMWAAWLGSHVPVVKNFGEHAKRKTATERSEDDYDSVALDIGSVVEDRLNAVGVSQAAKVTLTGHFYSSNSPDNWRVLLYMWAVDPGRWNKLVNN